MRARMYIEIDTEYGTITNTALCHLEGNVDDVHKLQYAGSIIYDRLMRDVYKEFKRRSNDSLCTCTIHDVGDTVQIRPFQI